MGFEAVGAVIAEGAADTAVTTAVVGGVADAAVTVGAVAGDAALATAGTAIAADVGGLAALDSAAVVGEGAADGLLSGLGADALGGGAAAAAGTTGADLGADLGGDAIGDAAGSAATDAATDAGTSGIINAASDAANATDAGTSAAQTAAQASGTAPVDGSTVAAPTGGTQTPLTPLQQSGVGSPGSVTPDTAGTNTGTAVNAANSSSGNLNSVAQKTLTQQTVGSNFGSFGDYMKSAMDFAKSAGGAQIVGGALKGMYASSEADKNRAIQQQNADANTARVKQTSYGSNVASYTPIINSKRV